MRSFFLAPEGMPMASGGSESRNRTPDSSSLGPAEDSRLRTEAIESAPGARPQRSKAEKRNNQGKGGKNGKKEKKDWTLDEIEGEYSKWQEELKGYDEGKSFGYGSKGGA